METILIKKYLKNIPTSYNNEPRIWKKEITSLMKQKLKAWLKSWKKNVKNENARRSETEPDACGVYLQN